MDRNIAPMGIWLVAGLVALVATLAACGGQAPSSVQSGQSGAAASPAASGGSGMCGLLTADDLRGVGLKPELSSPTANIQDSGQSAYCEYTKASGAQGGIEFDIFVGNDDPVGTQKTILADVKGSTTPAGLAGVDESIIGPSVTSGGGPFATIVVRKGKTVFTLAIPPGPRAQDQLMSLSKLVLQRMPS